MKLIDNWRQGWQFASTQLGVLGTVVTSWFMLIPDSAYMSWVALPDEVKAIIPPTYVPLIGPAIFVMGMIARFIKQRKLHNEEQQGVIGFAPQSSRIS